MGESDDAVGDDESARAGARDGADDGAAGEALAGVDLERLWGGTAVGLLLAVVGGVVLFPRAVYAEFVWHFFWGPVYADAHGAACAVWDGGAQTLYYDSTTCTAAAEPVAYPGYTLVSEVGYMVVLLVAVVGVVLLLRRLDLGTGRELFYGLFPFMFLGGTLRVVEDASDAARDAGVEPAISYPLNTLLISPLIYVTMFVLTLVALVGSVRLARTGRVRRYDRPLFAVGAAALALALGYLVALWLTTGYVDFFPQVTLLTVGIATAGAAATWWATQRFAPEVNEGTGLVGAVVIWGHAVDGAANVLILDWARELGLSQGYVPKHPVNQAIVDITAAVLPSSITSVTGVAWPFFGVKLAAATLAVWLFNDEIFEESPRYAILLLVAVLAVGLGPGSRDMIRATFGI